MYNNYLICLWSFPWLPMYYFDQGLFVRIDYCLKKVVRKFDANHLTKARNTKAIADKRCNENQYTA